MYVLEMSNTVMLEQWIFWKDTIYVCIQISGYFYSCPPN